ncbi:hypothetical protein [Nautilia lithotrophica]
MKKIIAILLLVFLGYSSNIEYYLYSINFDYKEFDSNGVYLDGDSSSLGSLNGIGIKYSSKENISYYIKGEYAYGSTDYDGSTWGGTPINVTKKNVYLLNIESGFHIFNNPYYLSFGYRFWNRGKSDYPGDYDEQYYWPYLGFGYFYLFKINKLYLTTDIQYQYAINPKLDVYLGSGTTLDLGVTDGLKFQLSGYMNYDKNFMINVFYRYQYWHISRSSPSSIILNGTKTYIIEPESYTRNQYIGVGVLFRF